MTKFTNVTTGYDNDGYGYHSQVIVIQEAEELVEQEAEINNLSDEQVIGGIVHSHYEDSHIQISKLMADPENYRKTHIVISREVENKFAIIFLLSMEELTSVICTVEQADIAEQCLSEGIFDFGFINLKMSDDE